MDLLEWLDTKLEKEENSFNVKAIERLYSISLDLINLDREKYTNDELRETLMYFVIEMADFMEVDLRLRMLDFLNEYEKVRLQ